MTDHIASATDATIRENVAQGLEDLARYGGNVMHSDRQNLLHKAIELLRSAGATGGPMRLPRLGITHPDFDSEQDIYNSGWNACVDRWFSTAATGKTPLVDAEAGILTPYLVSKFPKEEWVKASLARRIEVERDALATQVATLLDALRSATAINLDAERYLWVREHAQRGRLFDTTRPHITLRFPRAARSEMYWVEPQGAELDAEIDRLRAADSRQA